MPQRRSETQTQNIQRNNSNYNYNRTQQIYTPQQQTNARSVRNIQQSKPESDIIYEEGDNETETSDPENTCYIREMMDDWSSVIFIQSLNFTTVNEKDLNKNQQGEFWIKKLSTNEGINWLVDTGSPRSLYPDKQQKNLTKKLGHKIINTESNSEEFRCFNNNQNPCGLYNPT